MISELKTQRKNEAGYALLMAVFMVATMILAASVATTSILTQGRREMEKEMIWRGHQYERAIGLYYIKFQHYPTKIEDLTRQTNGVRFLRQAYTDPMNKEDGSWRFIYVGPNGQLIGSLRPSSLLQNTLTGSSITGASPLGGGLQPLSPTGSGAQTGAGITAGPGGAGGSGLIQQANPASTQNPLEPQPQPLGGQVIGGNIVGIGSKIKQSSFRVYQGGDTYQTWEFIWTPNGNGTIPGQAPINQNPTTSGGNTASPLQQTNQPGTTPQTTPSQ